MDLGWRYVLVFAVPALLVSGMGALALFGAAAGALWLFAFGDDPWPRSAQSALGVGFGAAWLLMWAALLLLAFRRGESRDSAAPMPRRDWVAAAGITLLVAAVGMLHQWRVGNLGPPSDSGRCAGYCDSRGYSGSSMPPRNTGVASCSCIDAQGREAITVPLGGIDAHPSK